MRHHIEKIKIFKKSMISAFHMNVLFLKVLCKIALWLKLRGYKVVEKKIKLKINSCHDLKLEVLKK